MSPPTQVQERSATTLLGRARRLWHRALGTKVVTLDGVRLACGRSDLPSSVRNLVFERRYERAEAELVREVVRPGTRVLEIGSGIGFVGLLCTRLSGQGHVRSYEANPRMEAVIRRNHSLNASEPDLVMKAITPDGTAIPFFRTDNVVSSSRFERGKKGERIEVESDAIDHAIENFEPDVIVMDIEGAECDVLPVADLSGISALVLELHPHIVGEDRANLLLSDLASRGFAVTRSRRNNVLLTRG